MLRGLFSRARDGYAGQRPCRLVLFSVGNYQSIEVGAVFADKIYDVFQPRMSGANSLTDEQRADLAADLARMEIAYDEPD